MDRYGLQSMQTEGVSRAIPSHAGNEDVASANTPVASGQLSQGETALRDNDPVLRTLVILQRQQREQTHLLRQLLQELEALKKTQTQQSAAVTKLDQRMQRARLWRVSWLVIRWLLYIVALGAIIYMIDVERILNLWERLTWLLT